MKMDLEEIAISSTLFQSLVDEILSENDNFGRPDSIIMLPFGIDPPVTGQTLDGYCGVTVRPKGDV